MFSAQSSEEIRYGVIVCPDCDLLNRLPDGCRGSLLCSRCGAVLARYRPNSIDRSLALTFTAVILFLLSNAFPFLAMESGGMVQETTLLSGTLELWRHGLYLLSLLVLSTCVLVPLLQMIGLLYILIPLRWARHPARHAALIFRFIQIAEPWGMMEVFMIGILVASVKLGHMASLFPGTSVFSFGALILVMASVFSSLDSRLLWHLLDLRR